MKCRGTRALHGAQDPEATHRPAFVQQQALSGGVAGGPARFQRAEKEGGAGPCRGKKRFPGVWLLRMCTRTRPHLEGSCGREGGASRWE